MQLIIKNEPVEYQLAMKWFEDLREEKVFVFEHQDVYTAGKSIDNNKNENNISNIHGIQAIHTNRGGLWTWHGKGQIVVYFIYNLKKRHIPLNIFLSKIENIVINNVKKELFKYDNITNFNVFADYDKKGVWFKKNTSLIKENIQNNLYKNKDVNNFKYNNHCFEKFGFIGLRISHGFVIHGISINYNNDLQWFNYINPCGLGDVKITSIKQILLENSINYSKQQTPLDINNFKLTLGSDFFEKLNE